MRRLAALILVCSSAYGASNFASGTITYGATTGNVSVTGLSFAPKGVLFIGSGQITQNALATNATLGFGAAISSSNRGAIYYRRNGSGTNSFSHHIGTACVTVIDSGGSAVLTADMVSLNSDGFTINVSVSPAVDVFSQWYAWGGAEVQVNLMQFNSDTASGAEAYTGMGSEPDAVIFFTAGMTATIPTIDGNARPGFGFVASDTGGTLTQAGFGNKQVSGANTSRRAQSTTQAVYIPDTSGLWLAGDVTSLDPDGFTFNWTTPQASTVKLWALGIRGIRAYVGTYNQTITTPASQSITAVGWTPSMLLLGSFCRATASAQQNDGVISIGGATGSAQGIHAFSTTTGGNNTGQGNYATKIQTCLLAGTPTIDSQATFTSMDATGFTVSNTTVDATAREMIYLAMGEPRKRIIQVQ